MKTFSCAFVAVGLIYAVCLPDAEVLGNPLPSFDDGDFVDGTWSHVVLAQGDGWGSVTRETTGGNPGAFLAVTAQADPDSLTWVAMWNNDSFWSTFSFGRIDSLTLWIDVLKGDSCYVDEQNVKLLVVQDGRYYIAPLVPWNTGAGVEPEWQTLVFDAVGEDDFGECPPWPCDPTKKPDFSYQGSVMYFGLMVGVSSATCPGPLVHGYDNWVVWPYVVNPVEPETWARVKGFYR